MWVDAKELEKNKDRIFDTYKTFIAHYVAAYIHVDDDTLIPDFEDLCLDAMEDACTAIRLYNENIARIESNASKVDINEKP